MKEPTWIHLRAVLAIQEELLARFGGLVGVRNKGLLESALARPPLALQYGTSDLFDLAAAGATGIVKNHPFLDGNKRAGFMAAYAFLGLNGADVTAPEKEIVLQTRGLAAGEIKEAAYAAWLRAACGKPRRPRKRGRRS